MNDSSVVVHYQSPSEARGLRYRKSPFGMAGWRGGARILAWRERWRKDFGVAGFAAQGFWRGGDAPVRGVGRGVVVVCLSVCLPERVCLSVRVLVCLSDCLRERVLSLSDSQTDSLSQTDRSFSTLAKNCFQENRKVEKDDAKHLVFTWENSMFYFIF